MFRDARLRPRRGRAHRLAATFPFRGRRRSLQGVSSGDLNGPHAITDAPCAGAFPTPAAPPYPAAGLSPQPRRGGPVAHCPGHPLRLGMGHLQEGRRSRASGSLMGPDELSESVAASHGHGRNRTHTKRTRRNWADSAQWTGGSRTLWQVARRDTGHIKGQGGRACGYSSWKMIRPFASCYAKS